MGENLTRRAFVLSSVSTGIVGASGLAMPALSRLSSRPIITHGVQSGDMESAAGMVWSRADRPSRMLVEFATTERFSDSLRLPPLDALPASDFTAKRWIEGLPADQDIFYRVTFSDLYDSNAVSAPAVGRFRTAPRRRRGVKFLWSGDTAGQGWGIDVERGGMRTFAAMSKHEPDFFLHSGDAVYCDNPILPEKPMPDGGVWKSLVAEGVEKVAETLDEFRGRWRYNMLDEHVRAFNASTPVLYQWDDHEVLNNWSSAKDLSADGRYAEKSIRLLSERGRRAFQEMTPIRISPGQPDRLYRKTSYGPMLDVFFVDLRSYRGANGTNREPALAEQSRLLGAAQISWIKRGLVNSEAAWKVIASNKSIGYVDWDDGFAKTHDGIANGNSGAPLGRELEFADLLRFIKNNGVRNVVWLTADIHYTAAHYYSPERAAFQDFEPFWEFVSGPLHAF